MYGRTFTHHQRCIWRLSALGASYREIAQAFGISDQTVKHHLTEIRARIGARHNTDLALAAVREQILLPSDLDEHAEMMRQRLVAEGMSA